MEEFLRLGNAGSGEGGCLGLFVHDIVGIDVGVLFLLIVHLHNYLFLQAGDEHLRHIVHLGGLFALTGDDQGIIVIVMLFLKSLYYERESDKLLYIISLKK